MDGGLNVNQISVLLEKGILWELWSFRVDISVQYLIAIGCSDRFNFDVIWAYNSIFFHSTSDCYFSCVILVCDSLFAIRCPKVGVFRVLQNTEKWEKVQSEKRSDVGTHNLKIYFSARLKKSNLLSLNLLHLVYSCYAVWKLLNLLLLDILYDEIRNPKMCNCSSQRLFGYWEN